MYTLYSCLIPVNPDDAGTGLPLYLWLNQGTQTTYLGNQWEQDEAPYIVSHFTHYHSCLEAAE